MKTALQEVFSDLEKLHPQLFNVYTTEGKDFINYFHKYLAVEKKQIIESYRDGRSDQQSDRQSKFYNRMSEQYYNETYKNTEQ